MQVPYRVIIQIKAEVDIADARLTLVDYTDD